MPGLGLAFRLSPVLSAAHCQTGTELEFSEALPSLSEFSACSALLPGISGLFRLRGRLSSIFSLHCEDFEEGAERGRHLAKLDRDGTRPEILGFLSFCVQQS